MTTDDAIKQLESLIEERTHLIEAIRRKRDQSPGQKVQWIADVRRNIEALEMAIAALGYAKASGL